MIITALKELPYKGRTCKASCSASGRRKTAQAPWRVAVRRAMRTAVTPLENDSRTYVRDRGGRVNASLVQSSWRDSRWQSDRAVTSRGTLRTA